MNSTTSPTNLTKKREVTFVVNHQFMINASGINTFLTHLSTLCKRNDIILNVYDTTQGKPNSFTRELMQRVHDIIITNDLESLRRCAKVKCNVNIHYLHIGDVHAFGYPEFQYNDMGANYVYEYLNALKGITVHVSQQTQLRDLEQRGLNGRLLQMPFYPADISNVVDKRGIISIMPDCQRKNLNFCLDCPPDIPFTYVGSTYRQLPQNFTNVHVDNSEVQQLIATHKALVLPSYIDTYGYVLLEAVQHTRPILLAQRWNADLPYDRVQSFSEVIELLDKPYTPVFNINEYSATTEKQWMDIFTQ